MSAAVAGVAHAVWFPPWRFQIFSTLEVAFRSTHYIRLSLADLLYLRTHLNPDGLTAPRPCALGCTTWAKSYFW